MTQRYFRERGGTMPRDAVTVTLLASSGGVLADIVWPGNAATPGGDYLYPTTIALALARARDVMSHYGFGRIVVVMSDDIAWDAAWGELVEGRP